MRTDAAATFASVSRRLGLLAMFGCAALFGACGRITTTPTTPSDSALPQRLPPERLTLKFRGTLADSGSFHGVIVYGGRDIDSREDYGRFIGGAWSVEVTGGTETKSLDFSETRGGRAVIEAANFPIPNIGVVFLWPDSDPALEGLTAFFDPVPPYDPDRRPTMRDFGALIPGSLARRGRFGIYRDGTGGQAIVTAMEFLELKLPTGFDPDDPID